MGPWRHTRADRGLLPGLPMVDLEHSDTGYKPAVENSSASTSPASSPTETAYLTHTNDLGGTPNPSQSPKALAFLRYLLPPRLRQLCSTSSSWIKGPQPPRPYKIKPIFERAQTAPMRLLHRWVPQRHQRVLLLASYFVLWLLCLIVALHTSASKPEIGGYGPPIRLSCISRLW